MPDYIYPKDGKFHTRPSELDKCDTPENALDVARQRIGMAVRRVTAPMTFGQERHAQFEKETNLTGRIPQVFIDELGPHPLFEKESLFHEREMATEPFKGVVIHFTPDNVVTGPEIVDYKSTSTDGAGFAASPQMPNYGFLLIPHGHMARKGHYLIERWDPERTEILGYRHIEVDIGLEQYAEAKTRLRDRVEMLMAAEETAIEQAKAKGFTPGDTSAIITV